MALPSCIRCGTQNPQLMHGLMSLWFGPLVELEADLGYFHLCPSCHDEVIVPELERIQNRILELHPAAQRHRDAVEEMEPGDAEPRLAVFRSEADDLAKEDTAEEMGSAEEEDTAEGEGSAEEEGSVKNTRGDVGDEAAPEP